MREICVDCGSQTDEMDFHLDMQYRCLPCKTKKLGRKPRQFTEEEVRERFLKQVWAIIGYWLNESRRPGILEKMEGLAFSMLVMLDGGSMNMPAFIVAPATDPDDENFHKNHGEDWYPHNADAAVACDISGGLHDQLQLHKPKDWPEQDPPPKPILPDSTTRIDTNSLMMMAGLLGRLQGTADRFSDGIWPSLCRYVKKAGHRGHSGMFGEVKMMVYSLGGRVMVTMELGDESFTVIGAEDDDNRGCSLHAIRGSANEAVGIVEMVVKNWDPDKLKRDDTLSVAPRGLGT